MGALDEAQRAADQAAKAIAGAKAGRSASTNKEPSPRGRRKLALEDLPPRRFVLVPPERLAPGGERLVKIGEEKTQLIERITASKVRIELVREEYTAPEPARADAAPSQPAQSPTSLPPLLGAATRVFIADMPERTISKSMVEPGFLALVLVVKFCDNIPLHRQEGIFKREASGSRARRWASGWTRRPTCSATGLLGCEDRRGEDVR